MSLFTQHIENYNYINPELIKQIKYAPGQSSKIEGEQIEKTDFHIRKKRKGLMGEDYWQTFKRDVLNILYPQVMVNYYGFDNAKKMKWEVLDYWYQIYNKGSHHDWHLHNSCTFSNVYFVKLQDKAAPTEFLGMSKMNATEGCLITWPSYMLHRAPFNESDERIIISFNVNVYE